MDNYIQLSGQVIHLLNHYMIFGIKDFLKYRTSQDHLIQKELIILIRRLAKLLLNGQDQN